MSDMVIASLIGAGGVFVGSVITLLGLGLQSYLQSKREQKQHLFIRKEELYRQVCDVLMLHEKAFREHKVTQECKSKYDYLQSFMLIYASKEIYKAYYELDTFICNAYTDVHKKEKIDKISNNIADKIEDFAKQLRKELGIKGDL